MRRAVIAIILAGICLGCPIQAGTNPSGPPPVAPAPRVAVSVEQDSWELATSARTVAELLCDLGITLGPLDRTEPAPDTPIADGLHVRVSRVSCRDLTEETPSPARTVVLADPDHPAGFTKILSHPEDGLVQRTWRIWEIDGQVTTRTLVSEQVLVRPQDAVVLRGSHSLPSRGGDWREWRRPLVMEATAYDPGPRSCGKWADGYTATGVKAEKGVVAVDERVIPMGTRLYIPGYGFAVAADRGSAIKGQRIDLCFPTYREAISFGRHRVRVYVLD